MQHIQVAIKSTSLNLTTLFGAGLDGKFIEINFNPGIRNFIAGIKAPIFLKTALDNVKTTIQFRKEKQSQHLRNAFQSRTVPLIFTLIVQELFEKSDEKD